MGSLIILEFVLFSSPSLQSLTLKNLWHSHFSWWPHNPHPVHESPGEVHFVWLYPSKENTAQFLSLSNIQPNIHNINKGNPETTSLCNFFFKGALLELLFFKLNYFNGSFEFNKLTNAGNHYNCSDYREADDLGAFRCIHIPSACHQFKHTQWILIKIECTEAVLILYQLNYINSGAQQHITLSVATT